MPNKQRKGNKRLGRGAGGKIERCHFHALVQLTGAAGVWPTLNVIPMNFNRPAVIVDNFDEYRLTKLKFRIFPTGSLAVAGPSFNATFFPTVVTTGPTFLNAYDNPTVVTLLPTETQPSQWRRVSKADLQGLQPWYKSENLSTATPDTLPGQFYIRTDSGTNQTINCEFDGEFQFRGETNAASTPAPMSVLLKRQVELQQIIDASAERERKKTLCDRNKLMLLLGYQESATVTSEGPIPTKWPLQTSSLLAAQSGSRKQ